MLCMLYNPSFIFLIYTWTDLKSAYGCNFVLRQFLRAEEVVTKNIPVWKSRCIHVCNVVDSDFYFPNLYSKYHNIIFKVHAWL